MKKYDYLIVGSGLFGSVFAHEARAHGKKCLVIDKRAHLGGNIHCGRINDIDVHTYGAHIFHTNNTRVWNYVNQFVHFNRYTNSPIANYKGEIYNLPFNMNTFNKLWNVITPDEAQQIIAKQREEADVTVPHNLEEQAIAFVGKDIYEKLIKGYTEKQWGRPCKELPASIIKRIPVRFIYDNNYFNDIYQGIPIEGYNALIDQFLDGIDTQVNVNYFTDKAYYQSLAEKVVYTGAIDEFYEYCYGELEYRSLKFETTTLDISNYQGNAVVNYTDAETPYTRIIEHKHFAFGQQEHTVITKEYPAEWQRGTEAYYPIGNERNLQLYARYQERAKQEKNILFGGRLAEYKYYNMDAVIESALRVADREF
ncbi:UDP-galactopyranose mutase [Ethanoligenens sp.]|uniref:UDP-galactopyranose mutase n=1 Tax=Ethanoligenens sp. TaxID=2099655 RepID=UPI0039E9BD5D